MGFISGKIKRYRFWFLLMFVTTFITLLSVGSCKRNITGEKKENASEDHSEKATYTGRESCKDCHEMQYDLYTGSDHDKAMQPATEENVLGNFNNISFTHFGVTSRFYMKENKYYVFTQGPEGVMQEYEIKYTFGFRPLQQYLIEFPGGRYQCLPICWDTRPADQGGQRWFHIYADEEIKPDDVLFWTKITQNWNYMCAECHSTNLKKNYNFKDKTYHTTWSEIDVSCEACHGPGSEHIKWAEIVEKGGNPEAFKNMGLVIRLKDQDNASWIFDPDSAIARRSVPRKEDVVVQMCARCHSRRSTISENYFHGGSLLNTHWPSLLEENLYFPDGQIEDEVYVYGSFLQTKMYQAGVSCKDCHEPHSGRVYVQGNALCYRCHLASKYGTRKHHFHDPSKKGASCFECHMHERTYMQIDPRRDHSIRIPRPDLSDKLGTPNACNQCHTDKSTKWATSYLQKWYGKDLLAKYHYGETFYKARRNYPQAQPELVKLASDKGYAPMVRATAIYLLGRYPGVEVTDLISQTISDPDPLLRYASLTSIQYSDQQTILNLCLPRLSDSIKLVRIMAAYVISQVPLEKIPDTYKELRNKGIEEYKSSLLINSDHPNTQINFGNLYLNLGNLAQAEASYMQAINLDPGFPASYINLADLYRREGRDEEGEKMLETALEKYPDMAAAHYALGLLFVRTKEIDKALTHFRQAAELDPQDAQYSYVYGIGLNSAGKPQEAIKFLEKSLKLHPYDSNILYALSTLNKENGNQQAALDYARKLVELYPGNSNFRQLLQLLGN